MTSPSPRLRDITAKSYHSAQPNAAIRLNSNESPFPPSPRFWERFSYYSAKAALNRYPDREAWTVRERLGSLTGVGPESIYVANGSNEVLLTTMLAYGGPGRKYASALPTYGMYAQIAATTGTAHIPVTRTPGGQIDQDDFALRVCEVDLAVVCSPNNPTGTPEDLQTLAELTPSATLFVADEAYGAFSKGIPELPLDHVARIRTFSKSMALAGARVGYCISSQDVVEVLWAVSLPYHLDTLKQSLILAALDSLEEYNEHVAVLIAARERTAASLRELGCHVFDSQANFLLFAPPGDAKDLWEDLLSHSILVRDATSWPEVTNCLRVTIGTDQEMGAFLAATQEILRRGE